MFSYSLQFSFCLIVGLTTGISGQDTDPCSEARDRLPATCKCEFSQLTCSDLTQTEDLTTAAKAFGNEGVQLLDIRIYEPKLPWLPLSLFDTLDVDEVAIYGGEIDQLRPPNADPEKNFFDGLRSIKRLTIAYVQIQSSEGWESFFPKNHNTIYYLGITGQGLNLVTLPSNFASSISTSLETVRITGTTLQKIESQALRCVECDYMQLMSNYISDIAVDAFWGSEQLKHLHLANNRLTFLPDGLFKTLTNLEDIRLELNPLKTLSEATFSSVPDNAIIMLTGEDFKCDCDVKWILRFEHRHMMFGTCHLPSGQITPMKQFIEKNCK